MIQVRARRTKRKRVGSSRIGRLAREDLAREPPRLRGSEAHVVEGVASAPPAPLRPAEARLPRRHRAALGAPAAADARPLPGGHVGEESPAATAAMDMGDGRNATTSSSNQICRDRS
ncbi:unnamed protein product, partial [Musa textilis]